MADESCEQERTRTYIALRGRRSVDSLRKAGKRGVPSLRYSTSLRNILFSAICHHTLNAGRLPVLVIGSMVADNPCPARQSGAMSRHVVADNAEGNALLSAARAAGPTCLNMLLWGAAKVGDRDAVKMLLAEGADREWCNSGGAEKSNSLFVAAKEGHQEVVKEMLSDTDKRTGETMARKALPFAAGSGHDDMVELLLKEVPREVLRGCKEAPRAVMRAVQQGHQGVVERLLASGLDVDLESDGCTPLQQACMNSRRDMAEYLLTAGADVNKEAVPLPSLATRRGAVCVSETGAPDPGQGCPWAVAVPPGPWLGAYSYQGSVMGQQANLS